MCAPKHHNAAQQPQCGKNGAVFDELCEHALRLAYHELCNYVIKEMRASCGPFPKVGNRLCSEAHHMAEWEFRSLMIMLRKSEEPVAPTHP